MQRRAKIIATIGPASQSRKTLRAMLLAGMDVARLNFSHGTHDEHRRVFEELRSLAHELERPLTIMQDLQGPKIRAGAIEGGRVELRPGQSLTLTTEAAPGTPELVSVDFPGLPDCVTKGSRILIDDGNLELKVTGVEREAHPRRVFTQVVLGGTLKSHKGINLPGVKLDVPALTQKDLDDLAFGLALGVDAVAMSFVRRADDLAPLRQAMRQRSPGRPPPLVIAKLERPEALENLAAIMAEADGVMVARGDLGVEMAPEAVPIVQKRVIELANRKARVVITATQMLESMIQQPRPTRAEASDVANAVFDGTDALMLSGETAVGSYPVQALRMMADIVRRAERHSAQWGRWKGLSEPEQTGDDSFFMTMAATELAKDRNVAGLVAFTESGRTARLLAKERPGAPILACTANEDTYRRLNLFWGVTPVRVGQVSSIEDMLQQVERALQDKLGLKAGQQVVVTFGYPVQHGRPTNMAYLHTIS